MFLKLNGVETTINQPCTKIDYHTYWCPTENNPSRKIYDHTSKSDIYSWGECSLSCMEPFNESSILLTTSITPKLINQLTFAPESKNPYGFKGLLSDVYIWKRSLLNKEIEHYVNCKIDEQFVNDAIISWSNWENYWTILETNVTKQAEKSLCNREKAKYYVGMNSERNFKDAFEICNSFGATLPMPDDSRNDEILWSVIEDPILDCKGKTWIGATDFQEEGKFVDVSKFSYKVCLLKVKPHIFLYGIFFHNIRMYFLELTMLERISKEIHHGELGNQREE